MFSASSIFFVKGQHSAGACADRSNPYKFNELGPKVVVSCSSNITLCQYA